jgi:SAM-dependent methyltransferase
MHTKVYKEFERICSEQTITESVLEIGATPDDDTLLGMDALACAKEKIGLNLDGPYQCDNFRIIKGNSNDMSCFEDNRFDAILCNAVLEHDKYFWNSLAEIRRVAKPGALVVIGTPGYRQFGAGKLKGMLRRIPLLNLLQVNTYLNVLFTATITLQIHNAPGDYYRFSPQAFREIFFAGMRNVEVRSVMWPPRIIGSGIMP